MKIRMYIYLGKCLPKNTQRTSWRTVYIYLWTITSVVDPDPHKLAKSGSRSTYPDPLWILDSSELLDQAWKHAQEKQGTDPLNKLTFIIHLDIGPMTCGP